MPAENTLAEPTAAASKATETPAGRDDHVIAPKTAAAAAVEPVRNEKPVPTPSYIVAHRLRAAFLHEQTSAFEQALVFEASHDSGETTQEAPHTAAPELRLEPPVADPTRTEAESDTGDAHAAQSHLLAALCLLALVALVLVLTGRNPRGS